MTLGLVLRELVAVFKAAGALLGHSPDANRLGLSVSGSRARETEQRGKRREEVGLHYSLCIYSLE
jgi:hypothetical protein